MHDGKFQNQPSLSLTKSNKRRKILKLIETKDCKNMILTILRRNVHEKSTRLKIHIGWNKLQAGNFVKINKTCRME